MAAAPVAVDTVLVAGAVTTGAPAAVVRCAALISGETGSLPLPARGRNISSPAIAMTTAATPADAYSTVRFLRAGSGESAWTGATVDRESSSAASSLATSLCATSARTTSRCAAPDSRPATLPDGRALSGGEMTIWEADGVCIEDAINEAAATAAVTVGVFARSRGMGGGTKHPRLRLTEEFQLLRIDR